MKGAIYHNIMEVSNIELDIPTMVENSKIRRKKNKLIPMLVYSSELHACICLHECE